MLLNLYFQAEARRPIGQHSSILEKNCLHVQCSAVHFIYSRVNVMHAKPLKVNYTMPKLMFFFSLLVEKNEQKSFHFVVRSTLTPVEPAWLWNFPEAWNWKETESYPPSLTHPPHSWKLAEGKVCNKKCCILTFHDKTVLYFNVLPKKVLLSGSLPPSLSATLLMWLKVKPELLQHYISYMTYNEICLMLQFWMSQIIKIHESWAKNLKTRLMRFLRFGWLTTTWWVTSWLCGKATHI